LIHEDQKNDDHSQNKILPGGSNSRHIHDIEDEANKISWLQSLDEPAFAIVPATSGAG